MGLYKFLCIFMGPYVSLLVLMHAYRSLRVLMCPSLMHAYRFKWVFVCLQSSFCVFKVSNGSSLVLIGPFLSLWILMSFNEFL